MRVRRPHAVPVDRCFGWLILLLLGWPGLNSLTTLAFGASVTDDLLLASFIPPLAPAVASSGVDICPVFWRKERH